MFADVIRFYQLSYHGVIMEPKKMKSVTVSTFPPSIYHEFMGPDAMILVLWMLNFKPVFCFFFFYSPLSLSSKGYIIKRLSAIRVMTYAYLRLMIFLPAVLIPACDSSSLAFHMMYSAHKLNKEGDNI